MKLAVLDPGGRNPDRSFPDGAGAPEEKSTPPFGNLAYAACTGGGSFRRDQAIPADQKEVLLILGKNLKACRQAVVELRGAGKTVAIAWEDAAPGQIATLLAKPARLQLFQEIAARADGALASTPDLVPFFTAAGVRHTEFIPMPLPVEDPRWDFSKPIEERRGILVGTRDFATASRQHLTALLVIRQLAASMYEKVTILNTEGWRGRRMIARLGFDESLLRVVEERLDYPRYLRIVAHHKLVWQLDATAGPGRIAGEALLARVPCVGGHGTTERLVFPDLCGHGRGTEQLFDLAARLLEHPHDCVDIIARAADQAQTNLSFGTVARRLEEFFRRIGR